MTMIMMSSINSAWKTTRDGTSRRRIRCRICSTTTYFVFLEVIIVFVVLIGVDGFIPTSPVLASSSRSSSSLSSTSPLPSTATTTATTAKIPTLVGPWYNKTSIEFVENNYWGRRPVLLKGAFAQEVSASVSPTGNNEHDGVDDDNSEPPIFPTVEELIDLAMIVSDDDNNDDGREDYDGDDEEGDEENLGEYEQQNEDVEDDDEELEDRPVSRLITSIPGDLSSYKVEFGPFYRYNAPIADQEATADVIKEFIQQKLLTSLQQQSNHRNDDTDPDPDPDSASPTKFASTLLLNDVDRFIPHLSDWMDVQFGFGNEDCDKDNGNVLSGGKRFTIPRWRRDDAQVSITYTDGGGIGPHVDHYDVFLIQTSGRRTWDVAIEEPLSVDDEMKLLVQDSEVSILDLSGATDNNNDKRDKIRIPAMTTIHLEPGDCLYVPPRFIHCGMNPDFDSNREGGQVTSSSSLPIPSMTLSVGCRGPSAGDLITRIAETIRSSTKCAATRRYTDPLNVMSLRGEAQDNSDDHDEDEGSSGDCADRALSHPSVRKRMKELVMNAINEVFDDEQLWDELIGTIVTEPKRSSVGCSGPPYPIKLDEMDDEWRAELGLWGDTNNMSSIITAIQHDSNGLLRRAEGVSFGWSFIKSTSSKLTYRIFAQGRTFQVDVDTNLDVLGAEFHKDMCQILDRVSNGPPIDKSFLDCVDGSILNLPAFKSFMKELIDEGFLYGDSNTLSHE